MQRGRRALTQKAVGKSEKGYPVTPGQNRAPEGAGWRTSAAGSTHRASTINLWLEEDIDAYLNALASGQDWREAVAAARQSTSSDYTTADAVEAQAQALAQACFD